ncbi:hypothetical protein JCM3774_003541 [Rhodotorula dairenensis]
MDKLSTEIKALTVTSFGDPGAGAVALAKCPDAGGKAGRPIQLQANLFRLKFKGNPSIAHYDCKISQVRSTGGKSPLGGGPNRQTSIDVWDALVASNPDGLGDVLSKAAFDCRQNAFTLGRLPIDTGSKTFRVSLPADTETRPAREFDVKLTLAQVLDLKVLEAFCGNKRAANLSDLAATAIMALDVLLRHGMFRKTEYVVSGAGRKFLNTRQSVQLGEGAQVLAGLFQSVRPTISGMVVNLDTAYSPYIVTGQLLQVCNALVGREQQAGAGGGRGGGRGGARGGRGGGRGGGGFGGAGGRPAMGPFDQRELVHLKRMLRGAKVRVTHRIDRRPFTIVGFGQPAGRQIVKIADRSGSGTGKSGKKNGKSKPTASEAALAAARGEAMSFEKEKEQVVEKSITVAEYFASTYNKQVNKELQCVELRGGQFVPIECLELLHGAAIPPTRLSASQASAMINVAAKAPAERLAGIQQIRQQADFGPQSTATKWGLEVEKDLVRLTGRGLPPPRVLYSPKSKTAAPNVRFGAWNLVDSKFLVPAVPLTRWSVAVFAPQQMAPPPAVVNFFKEFLLKQAVLRGMDIRAPKSGIKITYWNGQEDKMEPLKRAANQVVLENPENPQQNPPQMIFCLLRDPKDYDDIKRKAALDLRIALPTQVMLIKNIFKPKGVDQYAGNVLLKVNAKLQGINSTVDLAGVPRFAAGKTMLLGADVTHPTGFGAPAAGEEVGSSIAAVVGGSEPTNMRYSAQVREQLGRKEFITDLAAMAETLIRGFIAANRGNKPETIIMFRDGVSEGQWAPVAHAEVSALKAAFRAIDAAWKPKLTYIVCMKRHNIRLFCTNPQDADRTGNLPPGVVVDQTITHPYVFDFFLQAHAGLKGTARPTRYVVLLDENAYKSDELQKMTNSLSFSFARATRSTSLVPPAYYADIVATKARSFVSNDDAASSVGVAQAKARDPNYIQGQLDRLVDAVLATVPEIQPEATTASNHPLVPPTCVLLKLLGRNPAGTEQLARPDGLRSLLRLGGLERVAELPEAEPVVQQAEEGVSEPGTDEEEEEAFLAKEALADAEDDPLSASESEALRCLANTLTLHPSARDVFPDVVLADQRRGALRGLVRLLLCKRAGFLGGRLLFLLTSKPSEVIVELAHGGDCIDALQKFAARFLAIHKSPVHRALLSAGAPTTTYFDILKEHLKLAYNLMLQYSRAPPSVPEPFVLDAPDDVGAGLASRKKRFWRSKSISSGTDHPSPSNGATAGSPTPDVPPMPSTDAASSPSSPATDAPRSKSPASFAKRVVGAVKRSSPATSPKQQSTSPKAPNASESGAGNGPNSLSLTAAHVFLPLFRPYLVLATTLPLLDPVPAAGPGETNVEISTTVRAALNTLLNFPLELEELSGWSSSWLQYVPPRISATDGTVLPGGGIGSLGERLLEIFQAVCNLHFPADRVPPTPKTVTQHDREHGRTLEAPCHPDEWLPDAGGEAQKVDEVLGPVVLLLRKLSMLSEAQVAFCRQIFPADADRTIPLDRQPSLAGHLVRLMSSILMPNTAFGVGEFVYNLCDRSPEQLVRTIGYGNASGFLQNRQELIPPPPPRDEEDESTGRPRIDPITGAYETNKRADEPVMSDEEKGREAERLYTLFERMARTDVISTENPVDKARREGRLEETTAEREAELERIRREEDELEQEVERDLQEWRASRGRPAATTQG